jgi:hypothetical protein
MLQLLPLGPVTQPVTEYELRDAGGRSIGHVVQPAGVPRIGPGAETVFLIRAAAFSGRTISSAA